MEIEGTRRVLQQGQHYRRVVPASDHAQVTLAAGPGGHFVGEGAVNGQPIRFLVDTGATSIALPRELRATPGIDYPQGRARACPTRRTAWCRFTA